MIGAAAKPGISRRIEQYRAGAYDPPSPPTRNAAFQGLHQGEAGAKGPKDYRAVGLAKYGRGKDQRMSARKKWCIVLAVAAVIAILRRRRRGAHHASTTQDKSSDRQANTNGSSSNSALELGPEPTQLPHLKKSWRRGVSMARSSTLATATTSPTSTTLAVAGLPSHSTTRHRLRTITPPLDQEFDFARNRILGVNLGGWLVTEPFIVPALYEPYENTSNPAVDEFTLSQRYLSEGGADNLRAKMTEHYETFITEQDFANIAAAGLNWLRLPIALLGIETYSNEPFLEGVAWNYVLKAIQWARKLRPSHINLDLHAVPGSQNAYNHSGRVGFINYLQGLMGKANGQRTLDYIRQIAQFISQPEIRNVVPMFSVINEPYAISIGQPALQSWYSEVYSILRSIAGTGAGNGPYMTIHEGFFRSARGRASWVAATASPGTHIRTCASASRTTTLGMCRSSSRASSLRSARQCSLQHGRLHGRRDVFGHQRLRPLPQRRPRRTSLRRLLYRSHAWQLPVRRIVPAVRRLGELLGRDEAGPAPICAHVDGLAARLLLLDLEDRQQPEDGQADIADVVVFARTAAGMDADEPSG